MWKNVRSMNRIHESISGCNCNGRFRPIPYYVRVNNDVDDPYDSIEYSNEKPEEKKPPKELFRISAGEIQLCDNGEFGGYLKIGNTMIRKGNFSKIFEINGEKYVIDDLRHMCSERFELIKINDNGTCETIFNADEYADIHRMYAENAGEEFVPDYYSFARLAHTEETKKYKLDYICNVGLDAYCIGKDYLGNEAIFFLCSGYVERFDAEKIYRAKLEYLLVFNPGKEIPLVRINLPADLVGFEDVTSIWSDGIILVIGCYNQIVIVHLPDMSVEYRTDIEEKDVATILEHKMRIAWEDDAVTKEEVAALTKRFDEKYT